MFGNRGNGSPANYREAPWGRRMEAAPGFEPGDKGFAVLCLTTWLCRRNRYSFPRASFLSSDSGSNVRFQVKERVGNGLQVERSGVLLVIDIEFRSGRSIC